MVRTVINGAVGGVASTIKTSNHRELNIVAPTIRSWGG